LIIKIVQEKIQENINLILWFKKEKDYFTALLA
jgi:hypothetical protein